MRSSDRWSVSAFEADCLVLTQRRASARIAYRDILTAEHKPHPWGLRLHLRRRLDPLDIRCTGKRRREIEAELRSSGVRLVDESGAMITPTVADFEAELAREPMRLRQSSDTA